MMALLVRLSNPLIAALMAYGGVRRPENNGPRQRTVRSLLAFCSVWRLEVGSAYDIFRLIETKSLLERRELVAEKFGAGGQFLKCSVVCQVVG
jgi:hypothetical protein